ncbi:MAG: KpsF/GutQ family sugar-phosphate isomerase [Oligoflexales bacterium]|nr:KpsF/GutQ family sugar-phosphate isomerase [Oligoflexales bacterium]
MRLKTSVPECAREVLLLESRALQKTAERISDSFTEAVSILLSCKGKLITTGLGKSGHVAQKIASTFSSTGTSALFLHPSEALHGDFGIISSDDVLLAIAFGGETREVLAVVGFAKKEGLPVLAITGRLDSTLAKMATCLLDARVDKEADPFDLAPTTSVIVALGLGDALAVTVMNQKGFTRERFGQLHPGGSLGRSLSLVSDFMRTREEVSAVSLQSDFHSVLEAVTKHNFGVVPVLDASSKLLGCITDGDVRRCLLQKGHKALSLLGSEFMSFKPKTILASARVMEAVQVMEKHRITSLMVTTESGEFVGLLRLHDLISAKIL